MKNRICPIVEGGVVLFFLKRSIALYPRLYANVKKNHFVACFRKSLYATQEVHYKLITVFSFPVKERTLKLSKNECSNYVESIDLTRKN